MMKTNFLRSTLVLGFLVASLAGFTQNGKKSITLEDVFVNRKFSSRGGGSFLPMNDGNLYCQSKKDSINIYEYSTGKLLRTVVTASQLVPEGAKEPIDMGSYEFSKDETKLLFATEEEPIYRYSSTAEYYIYDTRTGKLSRLSESGRQRLAAFNPQGTMVAFVRANNLFVKDLASGNETQITRDGKMNEIINGATDWVYEEEFAFTQAFLWSPDGKRIAFYRFDESRVREYELTYYGDLYPRQYKYKYPKAGENNSIISLFVYDISSQQTVPVDIGSETDIYIPRLGWTRDPQTFWFYRMNRHQNKLELMLGDVSTGKTKILYSEENKYYIEITDFLTFLENGKEFILTSEKDGYQHLYLYSMTGQFVRQLTSGPWEVTDLKGVDGKRGLVYYVSDEGSPLDRSLYCVTLDGKKKTRITPQAGTNSPQFSKDFSWIVNKWSDINTPPLITVNKPDGEQVRVIQDNAKLKEVMKEYGFAKTEFFTFTTPDNVTLNGYMLKPADFDPSKKYPVLFNIYGGPGSQTVANAWGTVNGWSQLLAQKGIIIVSVDNRGTGFRGEEFKKMTYLQLGKYETLDQVEAAKYLGTLPYVNKEKIGMWGWSFGGYLTLSCLTRGADYFSVGVAVAPVTNWKYYDNIYTERFMRTPKENTEGYEENSPVNHADKLRGKLLIIHGMADDNVHPQNTYDMVTALVAANKQFDEMLYPNSNHGIYAGKNTTIQLYTKMTDFILNNLAK